MEPEAYNTMKVVISLILGGITVLPMAMKAEKEEDFQGIAWMFGIVAIAVFVFFNIVILILAFLAVVFVAVRLMPVVSKEAVHAYDSFNQQMSQRQALLPARRNPVEHLEGHVEDDLLEEQRRWLEERGYGD